MIISLIRYNHTNFYKTLIIRTEGLMMLTILAPTTSTTSASTTSAGTDTTTGKLH